MYFVLQLKAPEAKGEVKTNRQGKSDFSHFVKNDHCKNECPELTGDQKAELREISGINLLNFAK